ncbi:pilus assembly FimT family protein [Clostridium formicaceticum]|uniref:Prepilin-type N-terminal cleavage/methylation domain-containing protein n=1 Tax=Clostridium formicaceticum TaxID=1497 RepID=A0AAC9WHC4_9CLOT|nr:prepilin-type N-terminal cleavage/methylation domain-containing protein [Clostridium formicaceticum]ARE87555.1 hypothetical protein CLFO_19550 [Clostridium formicaceticum]
MKDRRGFTFIELIVTVAVLAILLLVALPGCNGLYHRFLLKTTADEMKSALYLAQQYSIDESRDYCFELFDDIFRIREPKIGGKIAYRQKIDEKIKVLPGYSSDVTYNCHGITPYSKFVLANRRGERVQVEVMLGTGRVRVSDIY